jgi:hypothetical protein
MMKVQSLMLSSFLQACSALSAAAAVEHDTQNKQVTLADREHNLVLRLNYGGRCVLDRVSVRGHEVISEDTGVCSALKLDGHWFTTRGGIPTPQVATTSDSVTVSGIRFGGGGMEATETWRFTVDADGIRWRIDRKYVTGGTLEDTYFPGWDFSDMSTWTGGLLGHGGVVWGKLFDAPNASYGVHNGKVTFWNKDQGACLRIIPASPSGARLAVRFSRQPSGVFSLNYCLSDQELIPKHGLSRFQRGRQDIWRPFTVDPSQVSAEFALSAPAYDEAYNRGVFKGLDGGAIREICHTIARIGAVDELIMGSNGYYSDCAVLHEPWIAQMGLAIDDPDYCRAFSDTIDYQRQHAIGADGRVKSRWAGSPGDAMHGTYDQFGYYECQWGWLMDVQPCWVINVAEQFDFNGDQPWLERQKSTCERVLDYMLRRDLDGDGLVKMMTDSHKEAKGSDWMDVVWAAYENALVNAQMYWAMSRWAELEELLGDAGHAKRYREAAAKLKGRFNQTTVEGGFWDAQDQCYAYWRDKDGSVHGTNLVAPVNFSAIGYGLCDDPGRRAAVLDRLETLMRQQQLFFWPLCMFSYAKEEGHPDVEWPFPSYENGDLFLAWGELGTRAYAAHNPALALKYVKTVLAQYAKDGLAFQRYLRKPQAGAGNDVLANNCSTVVGLYRNLYGVQPKHDRLYLEPHLTPELNGTRLNYWLRGKEYYVGLSVNDYAIEVDRFAVRDRTPFAVNTAGQRLEYFKGPTQACVLAITAAGAERFELAIQSWPESVVGARIWSESCGKTGTAARHIVFGLAPSTGYELSRDGALMDTVRSDAAGRLVFEHKFSNSSPQNFELKPKL